MPESGRFREIGAFFELSWCCGTAIRRRETRCDRESRWKVGEFAYNRNGSIKVNDVSIFSCGMTLMVGKSAETVPGWAVKVLTAAAVYNLAWGTFVIFWPTLPFTWLGIAPPNYPGLWQCIGMIVGVYGIGYGLAAANPVRNWPIVLVGLLGKIFGPIGFLNAAINGEFPWSAGWTILTNDLVWWVPFAAILHLAWKKDPASFPGMFQPRPPVENPQRREHRDFAPRVSLSIPNDGS
jgi:hypothetical protein